MTTYRIGEELIEKGSNQLEGMLAAIHGSRIRPVCLCRPAGIEMYVVHLEGRHFIKRMPNTGGDHDPSCASYEPPAELSGLGQVLGTAIVENPDIGTTTLKLQFSLTKASGRAAPTPGEGASDSVRTDGTRLSIRALLHFLWDQAGFQKWSPAMHGKRNWSVLRKYLLQASRHKNTKGSELADLLYIPEPFSLERKEGIAQRRTAQLSRIAEGHGQTGARKLMVLIAEVKELAPSRNGYKLIAKHLSDFHFLMNPDLHKRLVKRFDLEISLSASIEGTHLVAIATFGVNKAGVASIEEMGLMVTTDSWIPFESLPEKNLIDKLSRDERRFIKALRYNLADTRPLAAAVLTDTHVPTVMYIHPPGAGEEYAIALAELVDGSKTASWIWHPDQEEMPPLPQVETASAFARESHKGRVPQQTG